MHQVDIGGLSFCSGNISVGGESRIVNGKVTIDDDLRDGLKLHGYS